MISVRDRLRHYVHSDIAWSVVIRVTSRVRQIAQNGDVNRQVGIIEDSILAQVFDEPE